MAISTSPSTIISPEDPASYQALLLNQTTSTVNTGVFGTTNAAVSTVNLGTTTGTTGNLTVSTGANRSVVLAGITTTSTSTAILDSVNIYNTDKEIYVTGIDQGTTQQFIYNTTGSGVATPATTTSIGGVIVGSGLTVNDAGILSVDLPAATASVLGGIRVGSGLSINSNGVLSVAGGGSGYTLPIATASELGGVRVGSGLTIDAATGILSSTLAQASSTVLGGVKVGTGLTINNAGVLSLNLPAASTTVSGGVKVDGTTITINGSGVISAAGNSYTLPTASASTLGGVKVGNNLSIDANGVLSATIPASSSYTFTVESFGPVEGAGIGIESSAGGIQVIGIKSGAGIGIAKSGDLEMTVTNTGVTKILAGTGVTISSTGDNGTGEVTINASAGGAGTVTSVNVSGGTTGLTTTGGPILASGTITLGGRLYASAGGTGISNYAVGDMLFAPDAESLTRLAIGTSGQVLKVGATGLPEWASSTGITLTTNGTTGPATLVGNTLNIPQYAVSGGGGSTGVVSVGISSLDLTVTNSPILDAGVINLSLNTVGVAKGGTGQTSYAVGDMLYASATGVLSKRAIGTTNQVLTVDSGGTPMWKDLPASGGTVTSVSVATANGFKGTVATDTTTPAISIGTSITGLLKGNGNAVSAAVAGTDFQGPITLTTTGTSGAATFVNGTLNIPQYSGGAAAGVSKIIAGTGVTISSTGTGGTGDVTINASASGGSDGTFGFKAAHGAPTSDSSNLGYTFGVDGDTGMFSPLGTGNQSDNRDNGIIAFYSNSTETVRIDKSKNLSMTGGGSIQTTTLTSGAAATAGSLIGQWNVPANSKLTLATPLEITSGGTGFSTYTKGDVIYSSATNTLAKLGIGTQGQVLTVNASGLPSWSAAGTGTVTSITLSPGTTGLTVTNGTINSNGTMTLAGTLVAANGGTGFNTYTKGDIIYSSATNTLAKLGIGTSGQFLTVNASGLPAWGNAPVGGGTDTNTTYTVAATTATGGANIALTGSDSSISSLKLAAGSNILISRTDASTITIASTASGGGATNNPEIVVLKYTTGASGNLSGADCVVSTSSGVSVTVTDGANSIVQYTFTGKSNPPKSITAYGQVCLGDGNQQKFSVKDVTGFSTAYVDGGTSLSNPAFIADIASNTFGRNLILQTTMSNVGASASIGQRAHLVLVFGF